jgi:uncharacterized oligopeptide transporter (OPT) family protein
MWYNFQVMDPDATSIRPVSASDEKHSSHDQDNSENRIRQQRLIIIGLVVFVLILIALAVAVFYYLSLENTPTERIRDIMIIFMAFEFMVLGLAMVILIIQLATLINLLQNEIRPILDSTNETANTLRGTAIFLSDNLVEPVIKINQYMSGLSRLVEIFGLRKRKS